MNSSRPNSVKLAIGCLVISFADSLVEALTRPHFGKNGFAHELFGFFIVLFLVVMIYRRKNWARWTYAGCLAIWLAAIIARPQDITSLNIAGRLLFAAQLILWLAAAFMLFAPAANNWFRIHRELA